MISTKWSESGQMLDQEGQAFADLAGGNRLKIIQDEHMRASQPGQIIDQRGKQSLKGQGFGERSGLKVCSCQRQDRTSAAPRQNTSRNGMGSLSFSSSVTQAEAKSRFAIHMLTSVVLPKPVGADEKGQLLPFKPLSRRLSKSSRGMTDDRRRGGISLVWRTFSIPG